ncbi:hypothetical protein B0E53_05249 [Micromonospora sp. MH33]|nr:hypothetical protein B0E53_05249 [Micromonospora sp. MH33]
METAKVLPAPHRARSAISPETGRPNSFESISAASTLISRLAKSTMPAESSRNFPASLKSMTSLPSSRMRTGSGNSTSTARSATTWPARKLSRTIAPSTVPVVSTGKIRLSVAMTAGALPTGSAGKSRASRVPARAALRTSSGLVRRFQPTTRPSPVMEMPQNSMSPGNHSYVPASSSEKVCAPSASVSRLPSGLRVFRIAVAWSRKPFMGASGVVEVMPSWSTPAYMPRASSTKR